MPSRQVRKRFWIQIGPVQEETSILIMHLGRLLEVECSLQALSTVASSKRTLFARGVLIKATRSFSREDRSGRRNQT